MGGGVIVLVALIPWIFAAGHDITLIRSDDSGLRMARIDGVDWKTPGKDEILGEIRTSSASAEIEVVVDATKRMQKVHGFGASITESTAINLNSLPATKQDELLRLLFSKEGAALSFLKMPMLCNDFCSNASGWSTYDDNENDDDDLLHFSIARDLEKDGTLTFLKRAIDYGFEGEIQSYMDYAPDWMLSNGSSTLAKEHYDTLANYYAKFVQAYAKHGITISYLSLFNEPVDSYMHMTNEDMATLLADHVGPLFDKLKLRPRTKLTYGGQATRAWAEMHVSAMMATRASAYIDHISYHGYDCQFNCSKARQRYDAVQSLHQRWPDKELFMTEICYAYNDGDSDGNCSSLKTLPMCNEWPRDPTLAPPLPRLDFDDGQVWGSRIVSDVRAGASGWLYWNLLLSAIGGPYLFSPSHNDGAKNFQQAPIHLSKDHLDFHTTGLFFHLAHFSRFSSKTTAIEIEIESNVDSIRDAPEGTAGQDASGFVNSTHAILQLLNHDRTPRRAKILYSDYEAVIDLSPTSITTAIWELK